MGAYDDLLVDVPKAKGSYDDLLDPVVNPPSIKDRIYKSLNSVFQPGSVVKAPTEPLPLPVSNPVLSTRTDGVVDEIFQNARRPAELKAGARIVDGLPGVLEVGARKGYAGLGRIEAGAIKALADVLGSSTLSNIAAGQQRRAGQIEDSVALRGTPVEGFANDSIVQDIPAAGANAVSSVIQSLPALAAGPGALPALFATTASQEYGAGRELGMEPGGAALRAAPMAAFEVAGEKLGGFDKLADGLRAATRGGGVADLANAMVASSIKELPSEELTTIGQFGVDKLPGIGTNQEATVGDLGQQMKDTALATLLQSGGMGAGGSALSSIAGRQPQTAVPTPEPVAQPAPAVETNDIVDALAAARDLVTTPTQPASQVAAVEEQAPVVEEITKPGTYDDILSELPQREPANVPAENPQIPAESDEIASAEPEGSLPDNADRGINELERGAGDIPEPGTSDEQVDDAIDSTAGADAVGQGPAAPYEAAEEEGGTLSVEPQIATPTGFKSQNEDISSNNTIRPLVEQMTKRRAAAAQMNKEKQFDVALQAAKDLMAGKDVKPAKFKNAAAMFKGDKQLIQVLTQLHEESKNTDSAFAAQVARSQQAKSRASQARQVNVKTDGLMQAIAKLGGINTAKAVSEYGLEPQGMRQHGAGILRSFTSAGADPDYMRGMLADLGYPVGDTLASLGDAIEDAMNGNDVLTFEGQQLAAERMQEEYEQQYNELSDEEQATLDRLMTEATNLLGGDVVAQFDADLASSMQGARTVDIERALIRALHEELDIAGNENQTSAEQPGSRTESDAARAAREDDKADGQEDNSGFGLESQSSADLESRVKALEESRKAETEAARKQESDDKRGDFKLTGSDSEADQAAANGAQSLFSNSKKTQTPAFKLWFKNSKVVDASGNPLVVYHGTNQDINKFLKERLGANTDSASARGGFYFTEDAAEAGDYANMSARKQVSNAVDSEKNAGRLLKAIAAAEKKGNWDLSEKLYLELEESENEAMTGDERGANILPVYLSIQNPAVFDMAGKDLYAMQVAIDDAKASGHDGIRLKNVWDPVADREDLAATSQWVAFEPSQIKSATGNNGNFSPENDNINLSTNAPTGGMTVAQVRAAIAKDIFNQEVDVYQSINDAPDYIKTQAKSEGAEGVEGFYDGRTNRVALIANNLPNEKRAQAVARHELIGHYGLENMVGKDLMQRLSARVITAEKAGNKTIKEAAKLVDDTQPGLSDYRRGKEIIAVMAERNLHNDIVKRVMDAIRKFLKDRGFISEDITDVRISQLLRDATDYLKTRSKGIAEGEESANFSRKPTTVDSRDNWLFRRDDLGRIQLAPTGKAYDLAATVTQNLADKVGFGMASPELRKQIRHFKADMAKAMEKAEKVAKTMGKMSPEERALVSDVVEQMVKTGVTPPEHVMQIAAGMSQTMDAQTNELVDLGMLSKDTAERWRGKYLPRFYNREKDPALDTLGKKLLRTALPVRGLGGGSLKGRGLHQEINVDQLPAWEQLGWEVRDPFWKKNRQGKLELIDKEKVRNDEQVTIWRDFTPEERESMGENRDALFRFVMGYTAMQNDIALGRLFDAIAKNQEWTRSRPSEGYTKIPDADIEGTGGVKRYGNLAGLYVRDDIIQHITQFEESGELLKFYRKALSFWKMGKTVLNPVSHMNNVVSNLTMAHFAGVSYWDTHKYIGTVRDFIKGSKYLEEAKDVGLLTGDITRTELLANMPADIKALMGQQDSKITKSAQMTYKVLTFGLVRPMSAAYRFEDDFFKYLIYRDARENGASPDDAVDYATRYIFNYDDLPRTARGIRDTLIPFFAYTYKAVPALSHTLANYPWRFAAPAMAIAGINAIGYALVAGDDDDDLSEKLAKGKELESEERKNLPPWMRGKSALGTEKTIRLGTDPRTGLPLYLDVSRFIPGGDMFDVNNQVEGAPLPAPIMPSNPVLTTIAAMLWNKDTFTGKDVTDTNDTGTEKAQKRAEWLIKQLSPAIAPTGYHADRLMQAGADMADTTIETPFKDYTGKGKDGLPVQAKYAIPQTLGIKVKPTDLGMSADIAQGQDRKEISTIRAEIRQAARMLDKGAISQRSYDETEAEAMKKIDAILEKD